MAIRTSLVLLLVTLYWSVGGDCLPRVHGQVPYAGHSGFPIPAESSMGAVPESGGWLASPSPAFSGPENRVVSGGFPFLLRLDPEYTRPLLDFNNRQADKEILLMLPSETGLGGPEVIAGAQFRASGLVAHTNTTNRFSYLGRFPTDFAGDSATDLRMLHANQALAAHFAPWAHGYVETLFSDVFTFPAFNQGSFQVRQAYVTFGDFSQSPFYAWIGKKTVNFGDMGTLSPFSQAMPWHYFAPLAEGGGIGFAQDGLQMSVTALNGSRGIRVADSGEKGDLNNFAGNIRYEFYANDDLIFAVGGGYLHGTIYDGSVAEHINPAITGPRNGAWDVNSMLKYGPWRLEGEFVRTLRQWPVTGTAITAWKSEAAYDLQVQGKLMRLSGSWSEGIQGPGGSEFEFNQQLVLGVRYDLHPNVMMSAEYVRSLGFAPLIDITTVSDRNVVQNSFVLGIVLTI